MLPTVTVREPVGVTAGIATVAGTVMFALLLERAILAPPVAAAVFKVTVQVDVPGALTVAGEQLREVGWAVTVKLMVAD